QPSVTGTGLTANSREFPANQTAPEIHVGLVSRRAHGDGPGRGRGDPLPMASARSPVSAPRRRPASHPPARQSTLYLMSTKRRTFLQQVPLASAATQAEASAQPGAPAQTAPPPTPTIAYPRVFIGRHLTAIAFPLGGVAAGAISLGGRRQLRDWEIFNRPDKGNAPSYAFPAIWVQAGARKPIARVLESRIQPPYEGAN